jgi:hypothetical protein
MHNKLESYNKATERLMLLAVDYDLPNAGKFSLPEMVYLLRESFKYGLTYRKVFGDLRTSAEAARPATGFCLIASYYIYDAFPGEWKIMKNSIHWWLEHKIISGPFDITFDQFDTPLDYRMGVPEKRIPIDKEWTKIVHDKARILGRSAGLE